MYQNIKKKYPNKTPIIINKCAFEIEKTKFLLDSDMTVAEFVKYFKDNYIKTNMKKHQALIMLFNNNLEPMSKTFNQIENDNIVRLNVLLENTFG